MFTLDELQTYLKDSNSDFEIIAHETPIISTQDAAKYFDIEKAAPTLILQTEQGLIAFIVSSQRGRIDFKALGEELGYSKVKMADKSKVLEVIGYHPGAVPFIGHGLPCIFDNRLLVLDYIYGGSGDELHTLKIAPSDVTRLNNVIKFID
ncbi:hypothetical protein D3H35_22790 [Cohnella faecalis]|uniref:YbaK/aminoacyl-tRNA synthetase-associated domain-containing protein n=2 Tax=Cohnella faecalis TaxID=2315694 RepID=A0A398CQF2_9BACL|nr:hypothetical protein D3H35_22790 [Cohnella faecalis]